MSVSDSQRAAFTRLLQRRRTTHEGIYVVHGNVEHIRSGAATGHAMSALVGSRRATSTGRSDRRDIRTRFPQLFADVFGCLVLKPTDVRQRSKNAQNLPARTRFGEGLSSAGLYRLVTEVGG